MFSFLNGSLVSGGSLVVSNGRIIHSSGTSHDTITLDPTEEFDIFINDQKVHLVRTELDEKEPLPSTKIPSGQPVRVELRAKAVGRVITASASVTVQGDVRGSVSTSSGDVTVAKDVKQNVKTMSGNIDVQGRVEGNASTMSGNVQAEEILGSASSMSGSIRGAKRRRAH